MVDQDGNSANARRKSRPLNYFYLNGTLHKKLYINRPADLITAWSYPEHKRVGFTYSDVKKRHEKAFTTAEVSKFINRNKMAVQNAITNGHVSAPQYTYNIQTYLDTGNDPIYKYMWHEDDILDLHEYFSGVHYGRPRKDGLINPWPMPTRKELRALIRHNEILYVKRGEKFVPLWQAEE